MYTSSYWNTIYVLKSTKIRDWQLVKISHSGHIHISSIQIKRWSPLVAQTVKNPPAMQKTWVWSLSWEDPLEEGMVTHSSILAWRIPWTEQPGGLQSMGSQRVTHSWATKHRSRDKTLSASRISFVSHSYQSSSMEVIILTSKTLS